LIDVAITLGRNVIKNGTENKLKFKNLCTEIERMWNMKFVISVITGATGTITNGL